MRLLRYRERCPSSYLYEGLDSPMTVTETVLVFAGIPLAVAALLALLTLTSGGRRAPRYRPGRPFPFEPVWFLSAPHPGGSHADRPVLTPGVAPNRPALSPAEKASEAASLRPAIRKGGARGTW